MTRRSLSRFFDSMPFSFCFFGGLIWYDLQLTGFLPDFFLLVLMPSYALLLLFALYGDIRAYIRTRKVAA